MGRCKNAETGICSTCKGGADPCSLRDECDREGVPIFNCAHHERRIAPVIDAEKGPLKVRGIFIYRMGNGSPAIDNKEMAIRLLLREKAALLEKIRGIDEHYGSLAMVENAPLLQKMNELNKKELELKHPECFSGFNCQDKVLGECAYAPSCFRAAVIKAKGRSS